jgi:hypothetical protein
MKEILGKDPKKAISYIIPSGMFGRGFQVTKKQQSLKRKKWSFPRGNMWKSIPEIIQFHSLDIWSTPFTKVIFLTSPLRKISRAAVATAAPSFARKWFSQSPPSPMTSTASSGNSGGRQWQWKQRQLWGHTTINQETAATWRQKRHSQQQQRQSDSSLCGRCFVFLLN